MKFVKKLSIVSAILLLFLSVFVCFGHQDVAFAADWDVYGVLDEILGKKPVEKQYQQVYLGGYPLGITLDGDGVTVVGLNEFVSDQGKVVCPALQAGLQIGDVVVSLDGEKIYNSASLSQIAAKCNGKQLSLDYVRGGQTCNTLILPQKDFSTGSFRLGLWTKDVSSGVGTLTYVKMHGSFGCLGHPIADNRGKIVDAKQGGVYKCVINDVLAGKRGQAGELHGSFEFEDRIGSISLNNKFGVFGKFDCVLKGLELIDVLPRSEVKMGRAQIVSTIEGTNRQYFDVEIVKACNQSSPDDKSMVIRIVDKELIAKTGGIVQGMSGSPILQDGKLVGAVTHVFVNDPTKGYGIYAEWMLEN